MISIKTPEEIKIMAEGGKILSSILKKAKNYTYAGMTTLALDHYIENLIYANNAKPSFKNYQNYGFASCISINEEVVHGIPGKRIIKSGDVVSIDVGVLYKGFHNDAAVTFAVGKISEKAQKLIKITERSLNNGIDLVKPGIHLGDIQAVIQKTIENAHFSVVRDYSGHGIGRNLQEAPSILNYGFPGTGFVLKEGMTICIEPMVTAGNHEVKVKKDGWTVITEDKSLAAHFEHTILVTKNGHKVLTKE